MSATLNATQCVAINAAPNDLVRTTPLFVHERLRAVSDQNEMRYRKMQNAQKTRDLAKSWTSTVPRPHCACSRRHLTALARSLHGVPEFKVALQQAIISHPTGAAEEESISVAMTIHFGKAPSLTLEDGFSAMKSRIWARSAASASQSKLRHWPMTAE